MNPELTVSYEFAADTVTRSHSNFSKTFLLLSKDQRRAFCAVYSFMRFCDDAADGEGSVADKREELFRWRAILDEKESSEDTRIALILPAFRDTMQKFSIPVRYFHWIIDGTEMDLVSDRCETFDELYRYCFHVASAVGLVCLRIFGLQDEEKKEHAEKLAEECGIAFQLTNILRDIREDAERGRIYLPAEDLQRFNYTEDDLRNCIVNDNFHHLMRFEAERARSYYDRANDLIPLVKPASQASLWTMMEIYGRILEHIVENNYDVFGKRIRLSSSEKLTIMLKAFMMRGIKPHLS